MSSAPNPSEGLHVGRYLTNVAWSWAGVAVTLAAGFLLSPYIIRKVGDTGFGLWTLTLALVEYYWLIDLGFRSATLKYSAQYRTAGDEGKLNELLSTGLLYSSISGVVLFALTFAFAPQLGKLFHIGQPVFIPLLRIAGLTWALGLVFNRYSACLEGFQRFDITSRIWILSTAIRSIGIALLLYRGFGILQMGLMLMASQLLAYWLSFAELRKLFPAQHAGWGKATVSMLKQMARYGFHSFTVLVSNRLLSQAVPFLIAYFLPVRYVSYYAVPARLLDYAMEGIGRIGMITAPSAAALEVKGSPRRLLALGVYTNRYCLTIYLPVTVLLWVYGFEFVSLWIRPDFARQSAHLFRILLIGATAMAGQFNSVSILFGLGAHKTYARSLFAEAVACVAGLALVIPRFGITGAAIVISALMFLNRGLVTAFLASRELKVSTLRYLSQIYCVPCAAAGVSMAALFWLKLHWLPGRSWAELVAAAGIFAVLYGVLAFFFCLTRDHRAMLLEKAAAKLSRVRKA